MTLIRCECFAAAWVFDGGEGAGRGMVRSNFGSPRWIPFTDFFTWGQGLGAMFYLKDVRRVPALTPVLPSPHSNLDALSLARLHVNPRGSSCRHITCSQSVIKDSAYGCVSCRLQRQARVKMFIDAFFTIVHDPGGSVQLINVSQSIGH